MKYRIHEACKLVKLQNFMQNEMQNEMQNYTMQNAKFNNACITASWEIVKIIPYKFDSLYSNIGNHAKIMVS